MSEIPERAILLTEGSTPTARSPVLEMLRQYRVVLTLLGATLLVTAFTAPVFFSLPNIINVSRQAAITGIVAVGMTFVILTSGIDLSVGSTLALVGVAFALMLNGGLGIALTLPCALLVGLAVGASNGVAVTFLGVQPFIATLATMAIVSGMALIICNGAPVSIAPDSWVLDFLGNGNFAGIPGPVIVFVLVSVAGVLVLRYLPFGRYIYGIGGGIEAARLSGVRTSRVLILVYSISGVCAAIAGLITSCRLFIGHPTAGSFIMLDSIAAVVIGGTSLNGGRGGVVGTVGGVFLLTMVANLQNLLGVSPFNQQIAKGVIIILAVLFTSPGLRARIRQQWNSL